MLVALYNFSFNLLARIAGKRHWLRNFPGQNLPESDKSRDSRGQSLVENREETCGYLGKIHTIERSVVSRLLVPSTLLSCSAQSKIRDW